MFLSFQFQRKKKQECELLEHIKYLLFNTKHNIRTYYCKKDTLTKLMKYIYSIMHSFRESLTCLSLLISHKKMQAFKHSKFKDLSD